MVTAAELPNVNDARTLFPRVQSLSWYHSLCTQCQLFVRFVFRSLLIFASYYLYPRVIYRISFS